MSIIGLRYLDFCHLDTKPLENYRDRRAADGKLGLHEVDDMNEMVTKLDLIGEKEWFRGEMKMGKGACRYLIHLCLSDGFNRNITIAYRVGRWVPLTKETTRNLVASTYLRIP